MSYHLNRMDKIRKLFRICGQCLCSLPQRKNIQLPAILFLDGYKTHITLQLSGLCEQIGIILYLLPPNTTHTLQPAFAFSNPLKHYTGEKLTTTFSLTIQTIVYVVNTLLHCKKNALDQISKQTIVNSF